tara:strand:+ start:1744 stop:3114 length:1371 start_codon:yes stop_codon:yes gene_type:complete
MVKQHICDRCGQIFKQKGHLTNHLNRKTPCKPVENSIVEEKVKEKIQEMIKNGEIEIKDKPRPMKFIDLFCGIGGFHQALSSFGAECNLACDIDKKCREVYENNYKIKPHSDVRKIIPDNIDDMDIICGGFPCQAFSNAGNKKTFSDDRGLLFDEIMKIAINKKPKFMFLENVKHILKVGNGEVIKYIKEKLEKYEYILQLFEMSPHNYGIPQQRERIYFVCVRKDIYNGTKIQLPISTKKVIFENYLDKKEDIDKKYFIDGDILKCLEAWDEMIKIFDVGEKISPTIMINEHYNNHSEEEFNNYAKWRKEYITKNKPLILKYKDKWDKWYKKHREILQKREIYGKLEWQVGPIKPNDSIFNYFIQPRQSGIRVKKAQYFPTLVAIVQVPIYGKEKRYITPRECARLQSFPENFIMDEDDKKAYKQFGNAVNVDNVKTVIKATLDHYKINPKEYVN